MATTFDDLVTQEAIITTPADYYDVTYAGRSDVVKSEDTGDPLMTRETMLTIETILQAGLMPPIVLCGVVFNVINMAVFLRQGLQDRVTLCLFYLTVCDAGYLLSLASFRAYSVADLFSKPLGEYWKARMIFMVGVYHAFVDSSDCLTMLIAVERCICVLFPLKTKTWLSIRKTQLYILLVILVCVPANLVFCFKYDVMSSPDPYTNVTRYATVVTSFYIRHSNFVTKLLEIVNIVVPVTTFTAVIVATTLTTLRMCDVLLWRADTASRGGARMTSHSERREAAVTRMLTTVCVIFTVCLVPYVVSALFRLAVPDYSPEGRYSNTLWATTGLMHVFLCVNASISFVVYVNMSSRFTATLRQWMGRKSSPGAEGNIEDSGMKSTSDVGSVSLTVASAAGVHEKE